LGELGTEYADAGFEDFGTVFELIATVRAECEEGAAVGTMDAGVFEIFL
jgi:hypothetical protein